MHAKTQPVEQLTAAPVPSCMGALCCMYLHGWRQENICSSKEHTWECTERRAALTKTEDAVSLPDSQDMGTRVSAYGVTVTMDSGLCDFRARMEQSSLAASAKLALCKTCVHHLQLSCWRRLLLSSYLIPAHVPLHPGVSLFLT